MKRLASLVLALAASLAHAGEADVVDVKVRRSAPGIYDFDITVRSVDKGWDYFADAFEVLAPDGITEVRVRARHKPRRYDGKSVSVKLPDR